MGFACFLLVTVLGSFALAAKPRYAIDVKQRGTLVVSSSSTGPSQNDTTPLLQAESGGSSDDPTTCESKWGVDKNNFISSLAENKETQGQSIDQSSESLCGLVSLAYILALVEPDKYEEAAKQLYCRGETNIFGGKLEVDEKVRQCKSHSIFRDADWVVGASLAEVANDFKPFFKQVCGSVYGQLQTPETLGGAAKRIFGKENVRRVGGSLTQMWNFVSRTAHYKGKSEWNKLLAKVPGMQGSSSSQVILTIQQFGKGKLSGFTDHFIVLTRVITADDVESPCAKAVLARDPACVIWSWAKYYVFESCDNLRQMTADYLEVEFGKTIEGPRLFTGSLGAIERQITGEKESDFSRTWKNRAIYIRHDVSMVRRMQIATNWRGKLLPLPVPPACATEDNGSFIPASQMESPASGSDAPASGSEPPGSFLEKK